MSIAPLRATLRVCLATLAVLAAAGCDPGDGPTKPGTCESDDDCGEHEVCFPEGCGDPGQGIFVEVIPGASSGQLAQDFRIDTVRAVQNLEAFAPAVILGAIQQESPLNAEALPYPDEVLFSAVGESILIPGRRRSVQSTVRPDQGAYEVAMPAGAFTVTYTPRDEKLPPQRRLGQLVQPGQATDVDLLFPSLSSVLTMSGRLVTSALTNNPVPAPMQVQAFDPGTGDVYSQRAVVAPTGEFTLFMQPRLDMDRVLIRAMPRDSMVLAPSKDFEVFLTNQLTFPLELGEYLDDDDRPIPVAGRLVDSAMSPVAGAAVFGVGTARGEGSFKTPVVTTDPQGKFSLEVLEEDPGTQMTVWAFPPTTSSAGIVRTAVSIPLTRNLGDVQAPDKVQVTGRVLRPGDDVVPTPAAGVTVEAEPVEAVGDQPLPHGITRGITDAEGRYALRLDPGMYRLDFIPSDLLPRVSRFATVAKVFDSTGQLQPRLVRDFRLSRGRRITGTVSSIPSRLSNEGPVPAPFASVKFFRVVEVEGVDDTQKRMSVLLAETIADENGQYSVVLPTAEDDD